MTELVWNGLHQSPTKALLSGARPTLSDAQTTRTSCTAQAKRLQGAAQLGRQMWTSPW